MQAGENLNFIMPFEPFNEHTIEDIEKEKAATTFLAICQTLFSEYPENIQRITQLESNGFVEVSESSFVLPSHDGSYLHVLVFKHEDSEGPLDFGLSIEEHTPESESRGGYLYRFDRDGLTRSKVSDEVEDIENPHFSLIQLYQNSEEMNQLELYGDVEEQLYAEQVRTMTEEAASISMWEEELGVDGQCPSYEEIGKISLLSDHLVPRTTEL